MSALFIKALRSILWLTPDNPERNFISAGFHMITISLICMTLTDLNWFVVQGDDCQEALALSNFFTSSKPGKIIIYNHRR